MPRTASWDNQETQGHASPNQETYCVFDSPALLCHVNVVSLLKTFKITQGFTFKYLREPGESMSETPSPSKLSYFIQKQTEAQRRLAAGHTVAIIRPRLDLGRQGLGRKQ